VASWGIAFTVIAALTLIGPPVLLRFVQTKPAGPVAARNDG